MAVETASDSVIIRAPADRVLEAALAVETYPQWARAVKAVTVHERDKDERPLVVAFESGALGRRIRYTLRYDHDDLPSQYRWSCIEGDFRTLDGGYAFMSLPGERTRVVFDVRVELAFWLPRLVMRAAERIMLGTALRELKAHVEH